MQGLIDLRYKIKKHFEFDADETRLFIIYVLALTFIVGFNDGSEVFNIFFWLRNLLNSLVIVSLTMLVHESAHKIMGLHLGQRVEFKLWAPGLVIGLVFTLFSNGEILFLVSGSIVVHMMEAARIGRFRYGLSFNDLGVIAAAGPLANVALALILKVLQFLPGGGLLEKAIFINIWFALFNMLPIPPLDGALVLFASRSWYVFLVASIGAIAYLVLETNVLLSVLGAVGIGFFVFMLYFVMLETK